MRCVRIFLAVCVGLLGLPVCSSAQEPDEAPAEPSRNWSNTAELALVETSGNSEAFTLSLRDTFAWKWGEDRTLTGEIFGLRAESTSRTLINEDGTVQEESVEELTGEQYSLSAKYDQIFSERLGWYADAGWEQNKLAGLQSRFTGGGGLSYYILRNDLQKLFGEVGLGYRMEKPVSGDSTEFPFLRLFGRWDRTITETSSFETDLEVIQNLDDTSDAVANLLAAVTAKISAKLALKLSYTVTYRTQPIVVEVDGDTPDEPKGQFEFDSTDTILSASLVIDF